MTGPIYFKGKPTVFPSSFFRRFRPLSARLPPVPCCHGSPHASAPLAQTLRNKNVVMNQHLCRETRPVHSGAEPGNRPVHSVQTDSTSHLNVKKNYQLMLVET